MTQCGGYMNLNMTIFADFLEGVEIIDTNLGDPLKRSLNCLCVWEEGMEISSDMVYLCSPDCMPKPPSPVQHLNIICLGVVPKQYKTSRCEYIALAADTPRTLAMNAAARVFGIIGKWDDDLGKAVSQPSPFHALSEIAHRLFENDVLLWDSRKYLLAHAGPGYGEEVPDYPPAEQTFMDKEMMDWLDLSEEYKTSLTNCMPGVETDEKWQNVRCCLYQNLFNAGVFVARLVIEEHVRPLRKSDFTLVYYLRHYYSEALQKTFPTRGRGDNFQQMVMELVRGKHGYRPQDDIVLHERGWHRHWKYQIIVTKALRPSNSGIIAMQDVLYVSNLFEDSLVLAYDNSNSLLIIYPYEYGPNENAWEAFSDYLLKNDYLAAMPNPFENFSELSTQVKFAQELLAKGISKQSSSQLITADKCMIDMMSSSLLRSYPISFYETSWLRDLFAEAKKGRTDLTHTLIVYVRCGFNGAQAINELDIHKTTFYYRIKKISETYNIDLNDFDTRLYLMMIMRMHPNLQNL